MPRKLLLADDSVTIQRVIELTFVDEDIHVIAVGDGKSAIERIEREHPDIVLADIGMPERDGYEVAAFVKGHPSLSQTPVILLTGAFEPIDETRAKSVGCDGVLVKPFEPQMVINRVKDLLAGRRSAPRAPAAAPGPAPVPRPPQEADLRPATSAGDSLDAYFDRLDAAFATVGAAAGDTPPHGDPLMASPPIAAPPPANPPSPPSPAARTPLPVSDLSSWDPDLAGDSGRPAPVDVSSFAAASPVEPPRARVPEPAAAAAPASAPAPSASAPAMPPSLAEAFAALLSTEQRLSIAPSTAAPGLADAALIDAVVTRVLARLGESSLRPAILDAAERLVREEIEQIKTSSQGS